MGLSLVVEVPDGAVVLSSRSLDRAAIEAAARDLDLDDLAEPPATLAGLDLVGEGQMGVSTNLMVGPNERGHMVGYQDEDGTRSLTVTTAAGDEGDLASLRWQLGPEAEAVDLDGTTGWAGRPFGPGSASLVWQRADGVIVSLSGSGFEVEDLVEAASSLRVATDEEWDALLEASGSLVPRDALAGVSSDDGRRRDLRRLHRCRGRPLPGPRDRERRGIHVLGSDRCSDRGEHGPARPRPGARSPSTPPSARRARWTCTSTALPSMAAQPTPRTAPYWRRRSPMPRWRAEIQVVGSDGTVLGEVPVPAPPEENASSTFSGTATTIAAGG